jgi:hypothetical protein
VRHGKPGASTLFFNPPIPWDHTTNPETILNHAAQRYDETPVIEQALLLGGIARRSRRKCREFNFNPL